MKYHQAREKLNYALQNQDTIKISKLRQLLEDLNISTIKGTRDTEVSYLKTEISRLIGEVKELQDSNKKLRRKLRKKEKMEKKTFKKLLDSSVKEA